MRDFKLLTITLLVFMSCCANVVFLELIIRCTPGATNLLNFAQFALISVDGFVLTTRCGRNQSIIPLKNYVLLVIHFFLVSLTNGYAIVYKIPMPLVMIFRSGSLIANMILGIVILKRRYTPIKYTSVAIITIGIIICTIASVQNNEKSDSIEANNSVDWTIGIALMVFSLFLSANMGIFQEKLYHKFGKHPKEALFYTYFLQFPGFLLISSNIVNQIVLFNNSEPFVVNTFIYSITVPKLWIYLSLNCFTHYICIRSVFVLTTECTSLSVTLIVTLRKFLSLLFSIIYFQNPFTSNHWFGTALVFVGTLLFVDIPLRFFKIKIK